MLTVNIHDAKTRLSELIAGAVRGEPFIIAKAGKPMVRVTAIDAPAAKPQQRIGFARGEWSIPENFDSMFRKEIEEMFYESSIFPAGYDEQGNKIDEK